MVKPYFAMSYNDSTGTPNWVSWRVTAADLGVLLSVQDLDTLLDQHHRRRAGLQERAELAAIDARLASAGELKWVYLKGDVATIEPRLASRRGHYMPPSLLVSQFAALEEPPVAIVVDIRQSIATQVAQIASGLRTTVPNEQ